MTASIIASASKDGLCGLGMSRISGLLNGQNEPYWNKLGKAFLHAGVAGQGIGGKSWWLRAGRPGRPRTGTGRGAGAGARGGGEFPRPSDDARGVSVETRPAVRAGAGIRRRS